MRVIFIFSLLMLSACGIVNDSESGTMVKLTDLLNKNWLVINLNDKAVINNSQISFSITESGKVSGDAGVNKYFGQWQIDNHKIQASPLAATKMFRSEPKGIMAQEDVFLKLLATITEWRIQENTLLLFQGSKLMISFKLDAHSGTEQNRS